MKKTQKIGWQKYEDVLESRVTSPLMDTILDAIIDKLPEEEDSEPYHVSHEPEAKEESVLINMSGELSNEITLASSFDCWLGHTNFNLTEEIKDNLIESETEE